MLSRPQNSREQKAAWCCGRHTREDEGHTDDEEEQEEVAHRHTGAGASRKAVLTCPLDRAMSRRMLLSKLPWTPYSYSLKLRT